MNVIRNELSSLAEVSLYLGTGWSVCICDINVVQGGAVLGFCEDINNILRERQRRFLFNEIDNFLVYVASKYGRMMLSWGNRSIRGETCPSAIFTATNSTQNVLEMNQGLRSEMPATYRLSDSTA
jgi:hypothetical protein